MKLDGLFTKYDQIVFFDFETTGFSPYYDDIIEIGAISLVKDKTEIDELSVLVKLNKKPILPPKITEITNITSSMLDKDGIDISDARSRLYQMMDKYSNTLIVAHNLLFDLGFLIELFKEAPMKNVLKNIDVLDTLTVFKDRHPYPHKLSDAIRVYDLESIVVNSHRALDDVKSLMHTLIAMEEERDDLLGYVNLIGYNPKYPPKSARGMDKISVIAQPYNKAHLLYEER